MLNNRTFGLNVLSIDFLLELSQNFQFLLLGNDLGKTVIFLIITIVVAPKTVLLTLSQKYRSQEQSPNHQPTWQSQDRQHLQRMLLGHRKCLFKSCSLRYNFGNPFSSYLNLSSNLSCSNANNFSLEINLCVTS